MDAIRVEKESLENQINVCNSRADLINFSRTNPETARFCADLINFSRTNPETARFCYYYNVRSLMISNESFKVSIETLDKSAHHESEEIDGHSLLSAIVISINTPFENKRILLEDCLEGGCRLTIRDIRLSKLIFYENIPTKNKFILWFNLDILPEIKRYIIFYIIDILNVEYGLL